MLKEWMRLVLLDYIQVLTSGHVSEIQTVVDSSLVDARLLLNELENSLDDDVAKEITLDE